MGTRAKDSKWSQRVTEKSNALDLEENVFTWKDPRRIARSLKRSAECSKRRKGTPLQSAMSMLNFLYQPSRQRPGRGTTESPERGEGRTPITLQEEDC